MLLEFWGFSGNNRDIDNTEGFPKTVKNNDSIWEHFFLKHEVLTYRERLQ